MAHKRMFSKDITGSDAFREMPPSSQALYFHLGMEADDDGFLDNYRGIMRAVSASEDDLKILLTKRFLIIFPTKIVVVKHWLINNTIRKDRYHETKHLDEKKALIVKENGSYTEHLDVGKPNDNQMATQKRIEKDSIEEKREENPHSHLSYLEKLPLEDIEYFTKRFNLDEKTLKSKAEDLKLYCQSKNKLYKNYRSFLLKAIKSDFDERVERKKLKPVFNENGSVTMVEDK